MKLYSNFQTKNETNWILGKAVNVSVFGILFFFFQLNISWPKFHRSDSCLFIPAFDSMGWSTLHPKYQNFLVKFLQCTITMFIWKQRNENMLEIFCRVLGLFSVSCAFYNLKYFSNYHDVKKNHKKKRMHQIICSIHCKVHHK